MKIQARLVTKSERVCCADSHTFHNGFEISDGACAISQGENSRGEKVSQTLKTRKKEARALKEKIGTISCGEHEFTSHYHCHGILR